MLVSSIYIIYTVIHTHPVALPAKTRLNISLAVCAVALAGIFISDRLEKEMPPPTKTTSNSAS
jgi:hypothetical protein